MPETNELLGLTIDKNPVDFADVFDKLMRQKTMSEIESKKIELAQSIYGEPEEDDLDDDLDDLDFDIDLEDFLDDEDINNEDA